MKFLLLFILSFASISLQAKDEIFSPNGKWVINIGHEKNSIYYTITKNGDQMDTYYAWFLGFHFDYSVKGSDWNGGYKITKQPAALLYNEVMVDIAKNVNLIFRIYNDAVAYRVVSNFAEDSVVAKGERMGASVKFLGKVIFKNMDNIYIKCDARTMACDEMFTTPFIIYTDSLSMIFAQNDDKIIPQFSYYLPRSKWYDGGLGVYNRNHIDIIAPGVYDYPWRVTFITDGAPISGSPTLTSLNLTADIIASISALEFHRINKTDEFFQESVAALGGFGDFRRH